MEYPEPTVAIVEVDMAAPGLLVLGDSCYPGWTVTVDGEPAELLCTNYLVRGVELEAGPHRVRFEYRSRALSAGILVSTVSGAAVLLMLAVPLLRRRTGRP